MSNLIYLPGVYRSVFHDACRRIRCLIPTCGYDPVTRYPPSGPLDPLHREQAALFAKGYAAAKYAVARVLEPRRILEVGVGACVSARAFLEACPKARYVGIDLGIERKGVIEEAGHCLLGFDITLLERDSLEMESFPPSDLCHIDGNHDWDHCYHDVTLALRNSTWVLVDDARDNQVAAAAMKAALDWRPGEFSWSMFEDTWTGNLLFYTGKDERTAL